ncbi:MAG: LacI family DNA-binding transcriptional regulator [Planktomarina sp.]|jgi:DNA-binding LacI/PurR family transcriptional regulator|nr:LacI family DNA-binding transcriptional regulator [Planktomarina sp.]MDT2058415.1 LacI family DNA-binding transcriptional regulator [Planktomarina sp.]MDT2073419.1 LacI family DNA-binding transcriptional regulator [Planktomarina sp.]MDT2076834.1 LacI family DNA-binding transcriptional regulator [Planktomarina sp.]|tara:strand:- start:338 stop:1354 length:1017 start_codon:yes stop_codon:yes gene_type:complete
MDKVTSLEVAKRAGVSQSAVSRVFTPGASASNKTILKVREAAQELGYRPNVLARSLITGKSRIIGLIVAYLDNYFYPLALEKLSNYLQSEGYHVLIFMAANDTQSTDQVIDELLDYQVEGIITASVGLSSDLTARCEAAGVPVVLFNRSQDAANHSAVTSNNFSGGKTVAEFFLAAGHKRIGYIGGWEGASTQREREAGFRSALAEAGETLAAHALGQFTVEGAKKAARQMFGKSDHPDAVFVATDHMAFAVMDVLRGELNLHIPHDVSVVGYDDVPPASWAAYDLSTVRQRADLMVKETVTLMIEKIRNPASSPRHIKIDSPLIVRSSAKIPEGWTS